MEPKKSIILSPENSPSKTKKKISWSESLVDSSHEGDFENGEFHGNGTLFNENEIIKYQGKFQKSKRHGQGVLFLQNNIQIEGIFEENELISGKIFENRNKKEPGFLAYDGEFKNNQKHGK